MTATLGELVQRARSFVRDEDGGFIDDEDLVNWINEGYKDISARLEVMQRTSTDVTSGTISLTTTEGFTTAVLSLRIGTTDVQFVNDAIFNSWADATSTPPTTLAKVWANQIILYPTPDAEAYELKVALIPNDLVDSSALHVLPVQLERKLVEYAVAQSKLKDEDFASADRWFIRYEQGLPAVSTGRTADQPGVMSLVPEPSYFELDALQHRSSRA